MNTVMVTMPHLPSAVDIRGLNKLQQVQIADGHEWMPVLVTTMATLPR
jgi:hypothetical protein